MKENFANAVSEAQVAFISAQTKAYNAIFDMVDSTKNKELTIIKKEELTDNSYLPLYEETPRNFKCVTAFRTKNGFLEIEITKFEPNSFELSNEKQWVPLIETEEAIKRFGASFENLDWWFILDLVAEAYSMEEE